MNENLKNRARQAQTAADEAAKKVVGATGKYAPILSVATIVVVTVVALLLLGPALQALGQFVSTLAALLLRVIGLAALGVLGYLSFKVARDTFWSDSKES